MLSREGIAATAVGLGVPGERDANDLGGECSGVTDPGQQTLRTLIDALS